MARGLEHLQAQPWKVERISLPHGFKFIFRLCARTKMDGCAATIAQFQMARDEVGVEVSEEDVADVKAQLLAVGNVLLNVALRVDDDRRRTRLVSNQIRRVGQASQVILFQNHEFSPDLPGCAGTEKLPSKAVTSSRLSLSTYPHAPAFCALLRIAVSS